MTLDTPVRYIGQQHLRRPLVGDIGRIIAINRSRIANLACNGTGTTYTVDFGGEKLELTGHDLEIWTGSIR